MTGGTLAVVVVAGLPFLGPALMGFLTVKFGGQED